MSRSVAVSTSRWAVEAVEAVELELVVLLVVD